MLQKLIILGVVILLGWTTYQSQKLPDRSGSILEKEGIEDEVDNLDNDTLRDRLIDWVLPAR